MAPNLTASQPIPITCAYSRDSPCQQLKSQDLTNSSSSMGKQNNFLCVTPIGFSFEWTILRKLADPQCLIISTLKTALLKPKNCQNNMIIAI